MWGHLPLCGQKCTESHCGRRMKKLHSKTVLSNDVFPRGGGKSWEGSNLDAWLFFSSGLCPVVQPPSNCPSCFLIVWDNLKPYNKFPILFNVYGFLFLATWKALALMNLVQEDMMLYLLFKDANWLEQGKKQETYSWEGGVLLALGKREDSQISRIKDEKLEQTPGG